MATAIKAGVYEQVDDAIKRKLHLGHMGRQGEMTWHYPVRIELGEIVMERSDCGSAWDQFTITVEEWSDRVDKCGLFRLVGMWNFVPADDPAADCVRGAFANPKGYGREVFRLRKEAGQLETLTKLAMEVASSIPATYTETDPMVRRHAAALNDLLAWSRSQGEGE